MKNDERGLIKEILIIIVILIILGYFGINIQSVLQSSTVQSNLAWLWGIAGSIWSYIAVPVTYLWNELLHLLQVGLGTAH